jgi:hypothetical protein
MGDGLVGENLEGAPDASRVWLELFELDTDQLFLGVHPE